ncbi:hypothetical protein ATB97_00180 [Elizabethkingia bruuniana]|uniref:tetratricopeptide repeat protein n=1 Tax=Elizabethkingia bruuniana TaxID=1756149 RepID=UPI0007518ABA|nr:hypothetical protein [Elizabethkingia bruuniana]AQX85226.1 hypothetical protein AYC65_09490 [Elizabethkingia bruuniana]KUY28587.1 hypothetical protein ATB97_00180 [Elizabethkingia bruuniana]OPB70219.1 hypothetical protein BAY12_16290 [Elizabethkingia bruuniana]
MYKILFSLITLFTPFSIIAQNNKEKAIDSLYKTISSTIPYNVRGDAEKNLKVCTEIYYKSKEINYTDGQVKALEYMAQVYSINHNMKQALAKANEGLDLTKGNPRYTIASSSFLLLKGRALYSIGYFEEGRKKIQEAVALAETAPERDRNEVHSIKAASFYLTLESFASDKKHTLSKKEKEFYLLSSYKELQQISINDSKKKSLTTMVAYGLAKLYTGDNQLDKAEKYLSIGDKVDKNERSLWQIFHYESSGAIQQKKKNYAKAIEEYNAAIRISKEYQWFAHMGLLYSALAECYHNQENYKQESYFLSKSKKFNDSINIAESNIVNTVLKTETITEKTYLTEARIFYYAIAILLGISALGYYITRYRTVKKIQPHITDQNEDPDHEKINHAAQLAENNDPTFYLKFTEIFPYFSQNLLEISSKLSQSDLEYCALMKMNFDTKKIAIIKKISAGAVESKKHRIRKKLNISSEEDIYIWLMDK